MRSSHHRKRSHTGGSRTITTVSVALVLLILGIALALGLGAWSGAKNLRSAMGLVVVVNTDIAPTAPDSIAEIITAHPATASLTSRSADEVLHQWEQMMGPEELLDANPFLPEIEITVRTPWANADSLEALADRWRNAPEVDHVQTHSLVASQVNRTVSSFLLMLTIAGLILLVVSCVLIANTVRLQLHSERRIINTQQYVGATPSYIARPYIRRAAISGLIAAIAASILLAILTAYSAAINPLAASLLTYTHIIIVCGILLIFGPALCALAAAVTAIDYVNRSYEQVS